MPASMHECMPPHQHDYRSGSICVHLDERKKAVYTYLLTVPSSACTNASVLACQTGLCITAEHNMLHMQIDMLTDAC